MEAITGLEILLLASLTVFKLSAMIELQLEARTIIRILFSP